MYQNVRDLVCYYDICEMIFLNAGRGKDLPGRQVKIRDGDGLFLEFFFSFIINIDNIRDTKQIETNSREDKKNGFS